MISQVEGWARPYRAHAANAPKMVCTKPVSTTSLKFFSTTDTASEKSFEYQAQHTRRQDAHHPFEDCQIGTHQSKLQLQIL